MFEVRRAVRNAELDQWDRNAGGAKKATYGARVGDPLYRKKEILLVVDVGSVGASDGTTTVFSGGARRCAAVREPAHTRAARAPRAVFP